MRVIVKEAFHDKFHLARIFDAGEVVDFEERRAKNLIERGLVESVPVKEDVSDGKKGDKPPQAKEAAVPDGESKAETKADEQDIFDAKKQSEEAAAKKIAKAKAKLKK